MTKFEDIIDQTKKLIEELNNSTNSDVRKKLQKQIAANYNQLEHQVTQAEQGSKNQLEQALAKLKSHDHAFNKQAEKLSAIENAFHRSAISHSNIDQKEVDNLLNFVSDQIQLEKKSKSSGNQVDNEFRKRLNALNNYSSAKQSDEELQKRLDALNDFDTPPKKILVSPDELMVEDNDLDNSFLENIEESFESFVEEIEAEIDQIELEPINNKAPKIEASNEPSILIRAVQLETQLQTLKDNAISERLNLGAPNEVRKDPVKSSLAKNKNEIIKSSTSFLEDLRNFFIHPLRALYNALSNLFSGPSETIKKMPKKDPASNLHQTINQMKDSQNKLNIELVKLKSERHAANVNPHEAFKVKHLTRLINLKEDRLEQSKATLKNLQKCETVTKNLEQAHESVQRHKRS